MAAITLENVGKVFPNGHVALSSLTLHIADGELLVLVGPSGSGKSTALRIIAGLEQPTSGRVIIAGQDVTDVPSQERDLAMVFQSYALYPHKSVRDNLAFPLRVRGENADRIRERVAQAASMLGIGELLDRKPGQLSGGQRQRVALGRALVREPKAFLLDEPLSNLDPRLRTQTRSELAMLHRRLSATMVHVTHDQEEAMTLGTRIAIMHAGALQQVAPPMEVYNAPANLFVAAFVGAPAMNFLRASAAGDGRLRIAEGGPALEIRHVSAPGSDIVLGVRPQDIEVVGVGAGDLNGKVEVMEPRGSDAVLHVRTAERSEPLSVVVDSDHSLALGDAVGLRFRRDRLHLFDARTEWRLPA